MPRLNIERQNELEPERMLFAIKQLDKIGINPIIISTERNKIEFEFKGESVFFYPYSGWHTGKSIKGWSWVTKLIETIKSMSYSTIERKTCKCGCGRPYSLGYNGYRFSCAPVDVLEKVGSKKKVADKNRANRNTLARKLHEAQRELDPMKDYKETWFKNTRKRLTGICQCGCGNKSQKNDDMYFRHSCCHIFAKSKFPSIQYHPLNYVERAFFGGCHGILDDTSMDRWPNMADWDDIKEKFHILAPLLTDEERAIKFYSHLEKLIYSDVPRITVP